MWDLLQVVNPCLTNLIFRMYNKRKEKLHFIPNRGKKKYTLSYIERETKGVIVQPFYSPNISSESKLDSLREVFKLGKGGR